MKNVLLYTVLAAASVLSLAACDRADAQHAPTVEVNTYSRAAPLAPALVGDVQSTVWWSWMGVMTGATCCLSPVLRDGSGGYVRMWTLVCMRPGTPAPLGSLQGMVRLDERGPLKIQTALYSIELQPGADMTWGDVQSPDDIESELSGME